MVQDLSTALRRFDLRDWMLLKTRKPGPRTKKIDLPTIPYTTVRCGTPLFLGLVVAHRFYEKHVKMIANLVHANVEEHMAAKSKQKDQRAKKRRRLVHRELKIRHHSDLLDFLGEDGGDQEDFEHHHERVLSSNPTRCCTDSVRRPSTLFESRLGSRWRF